MKTISFYTKYGKLGASSRLRSHQFITYLNDYFKVKNNILLDDVYIKKLYNKEKQSKIKILFTYLRRFKSIIFDNSEVIIIEKELFPYIPYIVEKFCLLGKKYIIDIDDALFHNYDLNKNYFIRILLGNKIKMLFKNSEITTAGSPYIYDYAKSTGAKNVIYFPTVVELKKYNINELPKHKLNNNIVIGWIGTNITVKYMDSIIEILEKVSLQIEQKIVLHIIGANKQFKSQNFTIKNIVWAEESEVDSINMIDIGIMPLPNGLWEKGKCAYKLIQYMACQKPVIASNVGANTVVVEHGINGFLCENHHDWSKYLIMLLSSQELRARLGKNGRMKVESSYSLETNIAVYEKMLNYI
ncbi:MAG TPA: glycosyltransferase [Burkholderiales bacterium]|nr:glycosyltransferase [Burkholderiales bacterium]